MTNHKIIGFTAILYLVQCLQALPLGYHQKDLVTDMDAVSSAILPDGKVLAIEKFGLVHLVKNGVAQQAPFLNWETNTNSQYEKGMMAIVADPSFTTNGYIYVWYTNKREGANGRDQVSRFKVIGDAVDTSSEKLMIGLGDAGKDYHHGSGLAIGSDGKLYIASGCRGAINDGAPGPSNAADKNRVEGKILRINIPEGDIPTDNPFYATNTGDARAVYYLGLRNPFTMSFNSKTKALWFSEVQNLSGNDKVLEGGAPGTDYGFLNRAGAPTPLWTWQASGAGYGRAMIGSLWYTGTQFSTDWRDLYFFGNVASNFLWAYHADHQGAAIKFGDFICPIDVKMDAVGAMYVTTRCQTENVRYTTGKLTKVWYGDTEPTTNLNFGSANKAASQSNLKLSLSCKGRLQIELKKAGNEVVEFFDLAGKALKNTVSYELR